MVNKLRVGLFCGVVLGLCHLGWVVLVWTGVAKSLYDWILSLHFINLNYAVTEFQLGTAALLVVVTFLAGFVGGYVLAALWNWMVKS